MRKKIYVIYRLGRYVEDVQGVNGIFSSKRKAEKEYRHLIHATDNSYYIQEYKNRKGEYIRTVNSWGLEY